MVADGQAAFEAFNTAHFDLVLMDIQMPGLNGVDATRMIRAHEVEIGHARTPIIALTANVMTNQLAAYEEAGMDGFVPKPIDAAVLYAGIDAAIQGRSTLATAA